MHHVDKSTWVSYFRVYSSRPHVTYDVGVTFDPEDIALHFE